MSTERLNVKDLILIGIFDAIIIVLIMLLAMIAAMIPGLVLFANAVIALLAAPVYLLMVAKVPKTGVFVITGVVFGLIYLLMGNPAVAICLATGGLFAEVIASVRSYKSKGAITISYIVCMLFHLLGIFGPAWFFTQFYIDTYTKMGYPAEYFDDIIGRLTAPMGISMVAAVIAAAFAGSLIAERILKKHFEKAGII
jgi:energy-coupling factor transport system substrate-specific component